MVPVMLDLDGKRCVIIGGGNAARRKAKTLISGGADVTVIAETSAEKFGLTGVKYIQKSYAAADTENCFLVIAATDDRALNAQITADAREHGVNLVMSASGGGDLMFMAAVRSGDAVIAASTSGSYPLLSAKICAELSGMCEKYGEMADVLSGYRKKILKSGLPYADKRGLLEALVSDELLAEDDIGKFKEKAIKIIGEKL